MFHNLAFNTEDEMVNYLNEGDMLKDYLFGLSVLNDTRQNFTYKLRFPFSLRSMGDMMP